MDTSCTEKYFITVRKKKRLSLAVLFLSLKEVCRVNFVNALVSFVLLCHYFSNKC